MKESTKEMIIFLQEKTESSLLMESEHLLIDLLSLLTEKEQIDFLFSGYAENLLLQIEELILIKETYNEKSLDELFVKLRQWKEQTIRFLKKEQKDLLLFRWKRSYIFKLFLSGDFLEIQLVFSDQS